MTLTRPVWKYNGMHKSTQIYLNNVFSSVFNDFPDV